MSLDADAIIDRRRMARRVSFWRGVAIVLAIAAAVAGTISVTGVGGQHVARLPISGAIVSEGPLLKRIEAIKKNRKVAGVVLAINSPGGTTVGGERLYNALRDLDKTKPVVAHIGTLGASAAYMAALSSDHIVAQRSSLTGSIGVLIQYGQVSALLDKLGVSIGKVDSGPLKAEPSPFEPTDPAALAVLQSVVDDIFVWFVGLVEERRPLSNAQAIAVADGRIFTGNQALEAQLVDAIGSERDAISWLESERDVAAGLPVRSYAPGDGNSLGFSTRLGQSILDLFFSTVGVTNPLTPVHEGAHLDALWSIWQAGDGL